MHAVPYRLAAVATVLAAAAALAGLGSMTSRAGSATRPAYLEG
jgi:hypothetical protein